MFLVVALIMATGWGAVQAQGITLQLTMWGNAAQKDLFQALCDQFAASDPEVDKVDITLTADYKNKVATMLIANTPPDVAFIDSVYSKEWFAAGFFMDIEQYMKKDPINTGDFFEPFWDAASYAGKRFGLPMWGGGVRADVFAINRDLFNTAGLATPNVTQTPSVDAWTNEQFRQAAKTLTRDTNGDGIIDQWGYVPNRWWAWVHSNGGSMLSADRTQSLMHEPQTTSILQFLADMRIIDKSNSVAGNFTKGKVGIYQVLFPNIGQMKRDIGASFDWYITHQPRGLAGSVGSAKMNVIAIPKGVAHPEASWRLIRYLAGKESATLLARNYVSSPWLKSVALSRDFLYSDQPPYNVTPNVVGDAMPMPLTSAWAQVDKIWTTLVNQVFAGTTPATSAGVEMTRLINDVLKEYAAQGPLY